MERDEDWLVPATLIAITAALLAVVIKTLTAFPGHPSGRTTITAAFSILIVTAFVRFLGHLYALWKDGEDHPLARLRADVSPALRGFIPLATGVALICVFLYSISFLKSMISAVVPFWADDALTATDRAIFVDPGRIGAALAPLLPALGLFYGLWHAVHLGGILWVLHWRRGNKSLHVVSFMLTWSIGMTLAYIFSSAGPIFTGHYDLSIAPLSVRKAAEFLWANYKADGALLGGGISAFPSLHVAIAAWFALVLKDRGFPLIGATYLLAIFFCSIILGWHYAADGIAAAGIALLANRLAGRWLAQRRVQLRAAIPQLTLAPARPKQS
jgi:hypothetical protein